MLENIYVEGYGKLKAAFTKVRYSSSNRIRLYWYKATPNFGDAANTFLIQSLSGSPPIWVNPNYYNSDNLFAIGSIIEKANSCSTIWGSGFISDSGMCKEKPKTVLAVRGPLTRKKLKEQGISCPQVFGDPALLLPKFYHPEIRPKYSIGIVPHYVDADLPSITRFRNQPDITTLDPRTENVTSFVDKLLECRTIVSSSLHGIILAHAYGIPAVWITCSQNIKGGAFKYMDYFASIGVSVLSATPVTTETSVQQLMDNQLESPKLLDLHPLLQAFPYGK